MPHRRPELKKIIKELEHFIKITCEYDPQHPRDFVNEKCNDAFLMLQEADNELEAKLKKKKK